METSFLDLLLDKISHLEGVPAYVTIFSILLACGLGLPIPEDLTLFAAGYLAYLENIELPLAIVICFVGVLVGDFVLFMLGRYVGDRFFKLPGVKYVMTPERVALAQAKLKKNAKKVCFFARFLAGLRAPIYFSAGMLGVRPSVFVSLDTLAALLSVPALVYVGYHFGDEIEVGLNYMRSAEKYIMATLAILGLLALWNVVRKKTRSSL